MTQFFGKAELAARDILAAFENPNELPGPLAQIFIRTKDNVPCRKWSWRNQLLVALHGYSDARGFRQWHNVGRRVKKGERAFYILAPVTKRIVDDETSEERQVVVGFRGVPVFGLQQTDGKALPSRDPALDGWLESLPLIEVARRWGLSVEVFDASSSGRLGHFFPRPGGGGIGLGVQNLSTWAHELVHAADHRNGRMTERGQHWRSETVAELGAAVLLRVLGFTHESDMGGCWRYIQRYAEKQGIAVVDACGHVLERTCEAVALILDTAEAIRSEQRKAGACA